eukprot:gene8932-10471_t
MTRLLVTLLIVALASVSMVDSLKFIDPSQADTSVQAQTTGGLIQGLQFSDYTVFYGIPFAAPPVGPARWQPPMDPASWAPKILDTTTPGIGCPQRCELPPGTCPTNTSEDCLYLNVFIPSGPIPTNNTRSVLAFLPGGRFEQGAASSVLYNAETMVSSADVIVVTINYRLGALGFLVTPDFPGNFGFQDQRQALTWIRDNIHNFGGNNQRVTLSGQSAGATSIAAHITSPLSFGLFQQAISESNPFTLGLKTKTIAEQFSSTFATAAKCDYSDANCLLALTPDEVIDAQIKAQQSVNLVVPLASFLPWTPTIDGADILGQPLELIEQGKFLDIPMIIGGVKEEAVLFIYQAATFNVSVPEYEVVLSWLFVDDAIKANEQYPPNSAIDNRPQVSVLGTNFIFVCPNRNVTRYLSRAEKVFSYQFQHVLSFDAWGPLYPNCVGHVCHGSELPFVFDSASKGGYTFTPEEQDLAINMNNYWMNFVVNGDPNVGLSVPVEWPVYNETSEASILFNTPPTITYNLLQEQCDFLDNSIGYTNPRYQ